jgi:hypothetical protein
MLPPAKEAISPADTIASEAIGDPRLESLHRYWMAQRRGRVMPSRRDIDPTEIPGAIWPHIMILDVEYPGGAPRFRYRRVGAVFWRALGQEPTGRYLDEVLPETAGYRDYVLDIYREVVARRCGLYTENIFTLDGQSIPMLTKRISLPLSSDDDRVEMILAGHVFEYERYGGDRAFSLVNGLRAIARSILKG